MNNRLGCAAVLMFALAAATAHAGSANANRTITLTVPKGDIREALRLVAEHGGLNLYIGPEVEGEVSLFLTDATIDSALDTIAKNSGLEYVVQDGIVTVTRKPDPPSTDIAPPLVTRVFTLRSADAARVRDALAYALTKWGRMEVYNDNSGDGYRTLSLSELEGEIGDNTNANYQSAAAQARAAQQGGPVVTQTNPRNARRVVVTDVAENVERISDLIATLDTLPPQVLIEARIVEMSTLLQRELGIDWDINVLANGPVLNHELPLRAEAGFASGNQIRRSPNGTAQASAGLALGTVDFSRFIALLRIHQTDNALRLLANPRLLVFNNHSASILVGERYPLLESNVSEFGVVTESLDTYIPVGVQLEVQPTIMLDGRVSMMIHPVTSSLGDDVVGTTGIRVARIQTRELSTRIIMEDGQTVALGGLISDRKTRTINKVPGLGDIFGLSALFRQENPSSERVDLLVFVTAHIQGSTALTERDREIFESYEPNFKQIQKLQDVPLHFEVPTEYQEPKPMFGDPVAADAWSPPALRGGEGGYEPLPTGSDDVEMIRKQAPPAAKPNGNQRMRVADVPPRDAVRTQIRDRRRLAQGRQTVAAKE